MSRNKRYCPECDQLDMEFLLTCDIHFQFEKFQVTEEKLKAWAKIIQDKQWKQLDHLLKAKITAGATGEPVKLPTFPWDFLSIDYTWSTIRKKILNRSLEPKLRNRIIREFYSDLFGDDYRFEGKEEFL